MSAFDQFLRDAAEEYLIREPPPDLFNARPSTKAAASSVEMLSPLGTLSVLDQLRYFSTCTVGVCRNRYQHSYAPLIRNLRIFMPRHILVPRSVVLVT